MVPGYPLTAEEKIQVNALLLSELSAGRHSWLTSDFLRLLKWPQRRQPDLRDYLELSAREIAKFLNTEIGTRVLPKAFVSRQSTFLHIAQPNECRGCGRNLELIPRSGHENGCMESLPDSERRAAEIVWQLSRNGPRNYDRRLKVNLTRAFTEYLKLEGESLLRFLSACTGDEF